MAERNPDLKDVSDHEIAVRMSILLAVADEGFRTGDVRVYNPINQIKVLLDELIARHQVVGLSTLNLKGEQPPLGT